MPASSQLTVGNTRINVTNLDKVFYPETGFTKGQVLDYYISVSPWLMPHLRSRPITLKRYPEGVKGFFFYERNCPDGRPRGMKTATVSKSGGGEVNYCVVDDLRALVWAINLADLELHTFLHKATALDRPTAMAFDLDPGLPANLLSCCRVAMELKVLLDALHLESLAKTSGSKGLQVYVPLNRPVTYARTKAFAHELAGALERQLPDLVLSKMQKSLRRGKVFVDWSQNDAHKTTINVYSLRARERPTVSTPVTWNEIQDALEKKSADRLFFEPADVLRRVRKHGDLFAAVLTLRQSLPKSVPAP